MPYVTQNPGTTITASWANANVRDQVVTPFASASARTSAVTTPVEGMVSYRTDGKVFEAYDGVSWVQVSRYEVMARKTADESVTSSTTLQDDDELLWAVAANGVYALELMLFYSAGATGDMKLAWTFPTGLTMKWGIITPRASDGALVVPSGLTQTTVQSIGGGSPFFAQIFGVVTNSTNAGTLRLQWAQDTSDATASTMLTGSYGVLTRV